MSYIETNDEQMAIFEGYGIKPYDYYQLRFNLSPYQLRKANRIHNLNEEIEYMAMALNRLKHLPVEYQSILMGRAWKGFEGEPFVEISIHVHNLE